MNDRITNRADYERMRQTFCWPSPDRFNFGTDVFDGWAEQAPDRTAIHWIGPESERTVTFAELAARSTQMAAAFGTLGLTPGDRVVVVLPRTVAWWETLLGLLKAGLVAIPGMPLLTARDLAYRFERAEAAAVVTDADAAEKVDEIASSVSHLRHKILVGGRRATWHSYDELVGHHRRTVPSPPNASDANAAQEATSAAAYLRSVAEGTDLPVTRADDPALIYFTSGTTGMPKMVLHTHASYGLGHQVTGRFWLDLAEDDLHWNISDTGWAKAAWSSLFGPWLCGASLFVQHSPGRFQPEQVLRYLSDYPVTTMCAAPTIYRRLVQLDLADFRPKALRHCVAAG